METIDTCQRIEQSGEAVLDAKVFAVTGCVLADESNLLHASRNELPGFGDDGFKSPRAEFSAQVGNHAEGAGVVAAFGDLDVCRRARRG